MRIKLLLASLFFPFALFAQTPHALVTGTTQMTVTFANQPAGATNVLMVSFCPGNCSSGTTAGDTITITDSAGDSYVLDYRTDGPGGNMVFSTQTLAAANNIITVSIPASDTSVVMATQFAGALVIDSAKTSGDLLYAVYIGNQASSFAPGAGLTSINKGQWWTDAYGTLPLTPTFGGTLATFSVAYKLAVQPQIDTVQFPVALTTCAKCDSTDDQGPGALGILAGATVAISTNTSTVCSGTLNANAQMLCSAGINVAPAMILLTLTITSADGGVSYTVTQNVSSLLFVGRGIVNIIGLFDSTNLQPRGLRVWSQ